MCGIFGIQYGPGGPEAEEFTPADLARILFPAIVHRGPHAYGWMSWDGDNIDVFKWEGRADSEEAFENCDSLPSNAKWFVGHVRWATHGSTDDMRNNHPLVHGKVVGVHNGIIRNYEEILAETGREDPETEVDSEAIFAAINKWGVRPGLLKIRGDMAIAFTNSDRPELLTLARSAGRPMVYVRTKAGSTIFASEEKVISATGLDLDEPDMHHLSQDCIVRLVDGKVTQRVRFRKARYKAPESARWAPAPGSTVSRGPRWKNGRRESIIDTLERDMGSAAARQAQEERERVIMAGDVSGLKDGTQVGSQFVYNGLLVNEETYIQACMDEMVFDNEGGMPA